MTSFVSFSRRGIVIGELYFGEEPPEDPKVDLLRLLAVLEPSNGRRWRKLQTLVVDLGQEEDDLFAQMSKGTKYEVRRAMNKDGVATEFLQRPEPGAVKEFADYYDEFARSKDLALAFRPRLEALAEAGMLVLSRVRRDGEPPLAWHAYVGSGARGMLLYSASVFRDHGDSAERSAIGRANRYLHWYDITQFKAAGYELYDLGGLDVDGRSEETARIASFKRGFGGAVQPTHACSAPRSAKGRLVQAALKLRRIDF